MTSSNIVATVRYKSVPNKKVAVRKWAEYTCDPKKCDPKSINEVDPLNDLIYYSNKEHYLLENEEVFAWDMNGDVDVKKDLKSMDYLNEEGTVYNLVISFPPDFAINNGLISKSDYYGLTKNILPSFLMNAGFKIDNTIWYSVLHRNTKNPHMHLIFFEKEKTLSRNLIPASSVNKLKSLIANYITDNKDFYINRDQELKSILGTVSFNEFTKVRSQKMFDSKYRKELNNRLLHLYNKLPAKGRLQYNAQNMKIFKEELNSIIEYILSHDSIKYKFEEYRQLLGKKQKDLKQMYGNTKENKNNKYYHDQLLKLYSKIGNDILKDYKVYQSMDFLNCEKTFLLKHINELNFRSREYTKDQTKIDIAKGLLQICNLIELDYNQTRRIVNRWILNSKYDLDPGLIINTFDNDVSDLNSTEYYKILNRLGYNFERYKKVKDKSFYKELNYKIFFNRALSHLMYELENEEKNLIEEMRFNLD